MSGLIRGLLVLVLLSGAAASAEAEESAAWAALAAGGHVAMIRHANAPGPAGDPDGFDPAGPSEISTRGAATMRPSSASSCAAGT